MASLQPTPCPPPRTLAAAEQKVGAWLEANAAEATGTVTVTVSDLPNFKKSFQDVKPRRPTARVRPAALDAVAEDDTVDTFRLHTERARQSATTANAAPPSTGPNHHQDEPRRASTLFRQPAQRRSICPSLQPQHTSSVNLPQKRRISTMPDDSAARPTDMTLPRLPEQTCEIKKEPRRRTIFVPPDETTVMTIHPGNAGSSLATGMAAPRPKPLGTQRPRRPRQSDVFLEIAEDERDEEEAGVSQQREAPPRSSRGPRASLSAAPKRAPLGQRVTQPNALPPLLEDVPGSGPGKENLRPDFGDTKHVSDVKQLGEVKRLGKKRASMLLPQSTIAPDNGNQKSEIPSPVRNWEPELSSSQHDSIKKSRLSYLPPSRPSVSTSARRQSIAAASQVRHQPRRQSTLPRLAENISGQPQIKPPTLPVFRVLAEDVRTPQLYEDNWMSHQETAMTQLINSLFEAVGHAPTVVSVADKGLRQTLLSMHQDETNTLLHKRLLASLQFGALCLPHDTLVQAARFKDDLSQRQRFLDLWLKSYNLSALQVCAEVIVGREITMPARPSDSSGSDSTPLRRRASGKVIATFLKTFLVDNEDAAPRRNTMLASTLQHNHDAANDQGIGWTWRRTVLRSLMLILLLDRARNANAIPGCLFQTSSPCKSSNAVVQALSKILLPSIGDIPRVLGHLNYTVSYTQYPLQEFTYRVENLATDLRDGVRLTRLVETLLYSSSPSDDVTVTMPTGDVLTCHTDASRQAQRHPQSESWMLSQHLKFPCTSRTQKVYNAQIALAGLSSGPSTQHLLQNLTAEDIVDGHREKTVGLLWSLVSGWGLDVLVDFGLVDREIARLDRAWQRLSTRQRRSRGLEDGDDLPEVFDETETAPVDRHRRLLHRWSHAVGRLHGTRVDNLSTAFADGRAYESLLAEYTPAALPSTPNPTLAMRTIPQQLKALGCSNAFIALFPIPATAHCNWATSIPTAATTVPLLAFLASRLLPANAPHQAACVLQRAWRVCAMRGMLRRRVACARLARDCALVVGYRERIEWAARVIQRRWKKVCWL